MKGILLADDSRFMRSYLKRILNKANFKNIVEAENGVQVIDMYRIYSPEIVIMDITMPALNGIDALKEILQIDPHAKVIMFTALGQQYLIQEAIKIGAKDFVVKPYFQNLIPAVNKLC